MKQYSTVYSRNGRIYVQPQSLVGKFGPLIYQGDCLVIDGNAMPEDVGLLIETSLGRSQVGVSLPSDRGAITRPLLAASEARSWAEFQKSALCCSVERVDNNLYELTPCVKEKGGFSGLNESKVVMQQPSALALGESVHRCLQVSAAHN